MDKNDYFFVGRSPDHKDREISVRGIMRRGFLRVSNARRTRPLVGRSASLRESSAFSLTVSLDNVTRLESRHGYVFGSFTGRRRVPDVTRSRTRTASRDSFFTPPPAVLLISYIDRVPTIFLKTYLKTNNNDKIIFFLLFRVIKTCFFDICRV